MVCIAVMVKSQPKTVQNRHGEISIDVAMLGARLHYGVPRALDRAGLLGTFYTDVYLGNKPWLQRLARHIPDRAAPPALRRFKGRDGGLSGKVVSLDVLGLKMIWHRQRVRTRSESLQLRARSGRQFCQAVVASGLGHRSAIYAANGAALEIFQDAKRRGTLCLLEQTIAPHLIEDRLMREEAERWPGWEPGLTFDLQANPMAEREQAEWRLADCIVCGSNFVASSLGSIAADGAKCRVVPYGIDVERFRPLDRNRHPGRLNVLFVGIVGLRKGLPYLLEALRRLDSRAIQCRIVGKVDFDQRRLADYARWIEVVGHLPRSDIMRMYHWADVFVFPSICEGSATVTYEALAGGLPVITTPNAGSVVRDTQDGYIVPIRAPEAIADRLERLLAEPELLRSMSVNARERSREFDLASYGERLVRHFLDLIYPAGGRSAPDGHHTGVASVNES